MPTDIVWDVLLIDDEEDTCRQVGEYYGVWSHGDNRLSIDVETDFATALKRIEQRRYDLLIVDVFKGPDKSVGTGEKAGIDVVNQIKARRFVPVIFYTALPAAVRELQNPLIRVAEKGGAAFQTLDEAVVELISTGLMRINREFTRHVDNVLREYLWKFLPDHWEEITASGDLESLAYLLCRRLAASLDTRGAERLAYLLRTEETTPATEQQIETENVHPMQYYIVPPSSEWLCTGDVLRKSSSGESDSYWLILTPECDFIESATRKRKAEQVLIVKCHPLAEFKEYQEWEKEKAPPANLTANLIRLIKTPHQTPEKRQEGRFFFLPGAFGIPDLVVDFQQVRAEAFDNISQYVRIATVDSPFRESLVSFFVRYVGRVGTPDLDIYKVVPHLRSQSLL